ncbi:hypothetical protein [Nocardia salmonicida]|uniref:hypothetical protein n=1 Tax=Nocardia salmonicida TaxID=53431 RepID=UPI0037903331
MTLDDLAGIAAELDTISSDVVGLSVTELERAALGHGLSVISPATVEASGVTLGSTMSASDVVEIAVRLGAPVLYLDRELVQTDSVVASFEDLETEPQHHDARNSCLSVLRRINGYTGRIEVGFIHLGVPHSWSQETTWADEMEELDSALASLLADASDGSDDDETTTQLAEALASDPAFRRARTRYEHEAAARALPSLVPVLETGDGLKMPAVIQRAQGLLHQQCLDLVDELEDRLAELAASLATTDQFRSASSADGRRKAAQKWVMAHHTNELRLPPPFITELAAAAHKPRSSE